MSRNRKKASTSRLIYQILLGSEQLPCYNTIERDGKDYEGIETLYQNRRLSTEVGLVIGAITNSQQLIDYALQTEQKGGELNMCTALEELREEGMRAGIREGEVKGAIRTCRQIGLDRDATLALLSKEFALSGEKAAESMKKYW